MPTTTAASTRSAASASRRPARTAGSPAWPATGTSTAMIPADRSGGADATAVVFRPVRSGNAFEETVERLLSIVKLGLVHPGERLPSERELAGRLEVSRMTLREAIRSLADAGYVESRRGRHGGTFVLARPAPPDELAPAPAIDPLRRSAAAGEVELSDALTVREVLEVGAAAVAAGRFAAGQLLAGQRARLERHLEDCRVAEPGAYRRAVSRRRRGRRPHAGQCAARPDPAHRHQHRPLQRSARRHRRRGAARRPCRGEGGDGGPPAGNGRPAARLPRLRRSPIRPAGAQPLRSGTGGSEAPTTPHRGRSGAPARSVRVRSAAATASRLRSVPSRPPFG